jgi:predicted aldo/keto reductase-like oxidoreductase
MRKKLFLSLNASPSILGFGLMRLPTKNDGKIDFEEGKKMIDYAYSNGVNYFDTAYFYHGGESEVFAGYALADKKRDSFYLADKMPGWNLTSAADAERIFAEQKERCRVDCFDFYLCHALNKNFFDEKYKPYACDFLIKQREKGAIKRLGFSFHDSAENLPYILDFCKWDFAMIQYNYFDCLEGDALELAEILRKRNVPAMIMEPVRGGFLTKLCKESEEMLKAAAPEESIASWALRYAMDESNTFTVLSGMSNMEQMRDNIRTAKEFKPMTAAEKKLLFDACKLHIKRMSVPCTACNYCMAGCPSEINIPEVFSAYNDYRRDGDFNGYNKKIAGLNKKDFSACTSCGACVERCPQGINIPENMSKLKAQNK